MTLENNSISLEVAKKAFENFRKTKTYRGQPVPESLWKMARALTSIEPHTKIHRILGINQDLYLRHVLQKTAKPKPQHFIPFPIPTAPKVIAKATLPSGLVLEFLCPVALATLIRTPYAATHTTL